VTDKTSDDLVQLRELARQLLTEEQALIEELADLQAGFVIREGLWISPELIPHGHDVRLDPVELLKIAQEFQLQNYNGGSQSLENLVPSWQSVHIAIRLDTISRAGLSVDHVEMLRAELQLKLPMGRRDIDIDPEAPCFWEVVEALLRHFKVAREAQIRSALKASNIEIQLWGSNHWPDEIWHKFQSEASEKISRLRDVRLKLSQTQSRIMDLQPDSMNESLAIVCDRSESRLAEPLGTTDRAQIATRQYKSGEQRRGAQQI
jgi:hypothetical protein